MAKDALPSPAVAAPPVTANNAAALSVQQAEYRQQLRRKSLNQTIYAGATGGYKPAGGSSAPGANAVQAGAAPSVSGGPTKTG